MRVLSGIQPTSGQYHIGNYLGALKHWVAMQKEHECFFFIADLHALTAAEDPETLRQSTIAKAVDLLALGLDPEHCTIFVQSHVPECTELAWIFNTITPVGELQRMTQYKDKSKKSKEGSTMGLLDYPVLQAADILLYKTQAVPIGKDQVQHLELTHTIARKFNSKFGETFPEPKALVPPEGSKILSLQDPKKKMSKSDSPDTRISLGDEPDVIRKKIMKAVTDTGKDIAYSPAKKPGISNLLVIYSLFAEMPIKEAEGHFKGKTYAAFKKEVAEMLVEKLEPFRSKQRLYSSRGVYVEEVLAKGAKKASDIAKSTMQEVRKKIGLYSI
ncbi:MAG: tryptophan--tRNA ligase [Candidatus Wildermuthbacteria bacterium]|nr:tryptophan--tRNA ligase [Candidatus Wildermuthbacteria bacterium]